MPDSVSLSKSPAAPVDTHTFPLTEFYAHARLPLPQIEVIRGGEVPHPYQSLLVHSKDMTPTLEEYHNDRIHLEILRSEHRGPFYFREVILRLNRNGQPVEFGANKIHLACFPEEAQALILEEQVPLGRILKECEVRHHTEAKAFLRVASDDAMNQAFELSKPVSLYGRKALILDRQNRPLSEIVEILPPVS
jgi:chorismate-pyruvate lyase